MGRLIPVIEGDKYGEFTVLQEQPRKSKPGGALYRVLRVRCSCGVEKDVSLASLREGTTVSCGHVHREVSRKSGQMAATHGESKTPMYILWTAMIQRCHNKKNKSYPRYGGKGISVCDEWRADFTSFKKHMGERPDGMTLERKNSQGDYEPSNVRWATYKEQARNTSRNHLITIDGETRCLAEWCEITGVTSSAAEYAIKRGRDPFKSYRSAHATSSK